MTHVDILEHTIEATQASLEQRLGEAQAPHRDPRRPRDQYAAIDAFLAATSRHLAATEAVILAEVRHRVPDGHQLGSEYLEAARSLEQTLFSIKGRLYGDAYAVRLTWSDLWEQARADLAEHYRMECRLVDALIAHADVAELDGMARRIFDAEAHGPTRPHPRTPHTGLLGLVARRAWALADRFWDAAEGRVFPDPVKPREHRHESLIAQYLVADPKFDDSATLVDHHKEAPPSPVAEDGA